MGILSHAKWNDIKPFLKIEEVAGDGGRVRLEIKDVPPTHRAQFLALVMPCVACGAEIHPIRERSGSKHQVGKLSHLYYACTCPLEVRMGCARGKAARTEYHDVESFLRSGSR